MSNGPNHAERRAPRRTPYEIAFAGQPLESDHFPTIQAEIEDRATDAADPHQFLLLGSVGSLLHDLLPEDAPPGAVDEYGRLLFHGYHFWRFGRRQYNLDAPVARYLVETTPRVGGWEATPPHPAGYLQLPANLFWATASHSQPHEPVDGFFWTMIGQEDPLNPPYARLDALLALGVRAGRPGFTVMEVAAELAARPLSHWADADARPDSPDFENVLPGGEIQGLYALVTEAEALKLISLLFWYVAQHPGVLSPEDESGEEERFTIGLQGGG